MNNRLGNIIPVLLLIGFFISSAKAEYPRQIPSLISGTPAKLVFLNIEKNKYIVSDIRSNRFVELPRHAKEQIIDSAEAKQIVVLATNQRFTAYSALTQAWSEIRTQAGEKIENIRAEDYAALVATNQRLLNYNGANGVWTEYDR